MAYHRGDIKTWLDYGGDFYIWSKREYNEAQDCGYASGVSVPNGVIDELALMRFAELLADGSIFDVIERAARVGNFDGETLAKNLTVLRDALAKIKIDRWEGEESMSPYSDEVERVIRSGVCDAQTLLHFPSDNYFELIEGRLRPMHLPGDELHGLLTMRFSVDANRFVKSHKLGRCYAANTGFWLARDPDTVLAPDFAFVSKERDDSPRPRHGFVTVPPDLVLETRAPDEDANVVADKMRLWLRLGARLALDLDPATTTLTVYRAGDRDGPPQTFGPSDTFNGGDVLPGFTLPLSRLAETL